MQLRISAHDLLWTKLFYLRLMWYTDCSFLVMFALQVAQPADEPARPAVPHRFSANIKFVSFDTGRSLDRHGLPFPSMKCANRYPLQYFGHSVVGRVFARLPCDWQRLVRTRCR